MAFFDLLKLLVKERRKAYCWLGVLSLAITALFYFSYKSSYAVGRSAIVFFIDKGINFFILLPSLSFALLAMFPSFSSRLKLSMMTYEIGKRNLDGKPITKIENFLNQYMAVLYLSLINLCLTMFGFVFLGEIKDSIGPILVSNQTGIFLLSVYLVIYLFVFKAVVLELLMCVKLTYNLILNEFSSHINK